MELKILLKNGELFLISAVILAGAIGNLIHADPQKKIWNMITLGSSILMLLGTALLYGDVYSAISSGNPLDDAAVLNTSSLIFFLSVVAGGVCVGIGVEK